MPRTRKPARLYYRKDEKQWIIRDGPKQVRTGYGLGERGKAEEALGEYLANRRPPDRRGPAHPSELTVGEVLARYADDRAPEVASVSTLAYSIQALAPFWADLTCDAVKGSTCRLYEKERAKPREIKFTTKTGKVRTVTRTACSSTVRRELGVLQSALKHAHREALLIYPIAVPLPPKGEARDRWLTRDEVAALLRNAEPHIQRFIVVSIYTGRRVEAVLDLTWVRTDLEAGNIRFRGEGQVETNKRRGRVRMPRQLKSHLERWSEHGGSHVVMYRGKRISSVKTGVRRAAERAGIEGVTPHVLKHTAITWGVKDGMEMKDAAEYFDTSTETIHKHYWHHSPHHQARALNIIENRR